MIYCCKDMDTGFHFPRVSTLSDAACGNGGSSKSGVQIGYSFTKSSLDLDARFGRSTVSTCGIGEGRDPGEMKASVHVVTTVCHVRGVGRSRRPCIAVCLRNPLNSRPRLDPALNSSYYSTLLFIGVCGAGEYRIQYAAGRVGMAGYGSSV